MKTYTQEELERALKLQQRLAAAGVDQDYAEIRVQRVLDRLNEPAETLAEEILGSTPEKFMDAPKDSASGTFHDELRRRIEAEKAAKRGDEPKREGFYAEIRARVRAELDANKPRDLVADLVRRTGGLDERASIHRGALEGRARSKPEAEC